MIPTLMDFHNDILSSNLTYIRVYYYNVYTSMEIRDIFHVIYQLPEDYNVDWITAIIPNNNYNLTVCTDKFVKWYNTHGHKIIPSYHQNRSIGLAEIQTTAKILDDGDLVPTDISFIDLRWTVESSSPQIPHSNYEICFAYIPDDDLRFRYQLAFQKMGKM